MNNDYTFDAHRVIICDRLHSEFTGIDDVLSFDCDEITVHSVLGDMIIEGNELKIDCFSSEKALLLISGKINGILYLESDSKKHAPKRSRSK